MEEPGSHAVDSGRQGTVGAGPVDILGLCGTGKLPEFRVKGCRHILSQEPLPATVLLFLQPEAVVDIVVTDASTLPGRPDIAAIGAQPVIVHPEPDIPGGFAEAAGVAVVVVASRLLNIAPGCVFDELHLLVGHRSALHSGHQPVRKAEIPLLVKPVAVRALVGGAPGVRPDGAEGNLVLLDLGSALREEEFPVLVQREILIPILKPRRKLGPRIAGGQEFPGVVVDPVAAAIGGNAHSGRQAVIVVVFLPDQYGVTVRFQGLEGLFAAAQSRLLLTGQGLPVDMEGGIEGAGLAIPGDGHLDPVVPGWKRAVVQCPVHVLPQIGFALRPGLGKAHAALQHLPLIRQAGDLLPGGFLPDFQGGIPDLHGLGLLAEPFLHGNDHSPAGGGQAVHTGRYAPVRVFRQLRRYRRSEGLRGLPAAFNEGGFRVLRRGRPVGAQAQGHEHHSADSQQAHPEAGLAVIENGEDAVFHADFSKGHGAGGIVDILCAALQQGGRIGLPLGGLHKPDHPLVTGHLHIPAEQGVGQPHQGVVPVEGQGQKANELDPVVPLIQVGPLVGQDLAALVLGHPGGDIDLRLQKAQNEGGLDFVRLPASPDFHRVSHLGSEFQIGNQAVAQNDQSQQAVGNGNHRQESAKAGHIQAQRLQAQTADQRDGQQKPEARQHPQETDVLFGRFPKDRPEKQHRQNHNAAVEIGGQEILEQFFHHSSSG